MHQTFYGKLQTTTTCQNCNGVTNQVQSFLDLKSAAPDLPWFGKCSLAANAALILSLHALGLAPRVERRPRPPGWR